MIYLIGGAPCSGKSTLAKSVANKLSIPIIGTDIIRSWMQKMLPREKHPELFHAVDLNAEEYLTNNSSEEIVKREIAQQKVVLKGILSFIQANYEWNSYIVEGTGITPSLIEESKKLEKDISSVVLVDNDEDRIRKTIFERGLWGEPETYSDELKEFEVKWVLEFNKWFEVESKKLETPYLTIEDRDLLSEKAFYLLKLK